MVSCVSESSIEIGPEGYHSVKLAADTNSTVRFVSQVAQKMIHIFGTQVNQCLGVFFSILEIFRLYPICTILIILDEYDFKIQNYNPRVRKLTKS